MTDRELLEAAAKAAGYGRLKYFDDGPYVAHGLHGEDRFAWNPLTDDGDALRLAAKLGTCIYFAGGWTAAYAGSPMADQFSERHGDDAAAATRRAIVRAAAAMAKG